MRFSFFLALHLFSVHLKMFLLYQYMLLYGIAFIYIAFIITFIIIIVIKEKIAFKEKFSFKVHSNCFNISFLYHFLNQTL